MHNNNTFQILLYWHSTTIPQSQAKSDTCITTWGRAFLLPVDISPCPVLSAFMSHHSPPSDRP